jgi:hypothetical protein
MLGKIADAVIRYEVSRRHPNETPSSDDEGVAVEGKAMRFSFDQDLQGDRGPSSTDNVFMFEKFDVNSILGSLGPESEHISTSDGPDVHHDAEPLVQDLGDARDRVFSCEIHSACVTAVRDEGWHFFSI